MRIFARVYINFFVFIAYSYCDAVVLPVPTTTYQHKSQYFSHQHIDDVLWPIVKQYTAYPDIPSWYANSQTGPKHFSTQADLSKPLTLRDVIWIVLRNNPAIKNAEMQRAEEKFALRIAKWRLQPQFSDNFSFSKNLNMHQSTYNASVGADWQIPFSTRLQAGYSNNTSGIFNRNNQYSASITQPLLRGGWFMPELSYLSAVDTEKQQRLQFKQNIMTVVNQVIADYMGLVQAYNDLTLQQRQLDETNRRLDQDKLKVKAGKMSRSNYLQEQVQYEQYQLNISRQQNTVHNSYVAFLTKLGLVAQAKIDFDKHIDTTGFDVPSREQSIHLALQNNPQYQADFLALKNAERALTQARNDILPKFDVSVGTTFGIKQTPEHTVGMNISVPINPLDKREAIFNARVALQQQKIKIQEDKQALMSLVTNQWQTIQADLQQVKISKKAVQMQAQSVKDTQLLLEYGRTTMFEYLRLRDQLLSQQQGYVSNQIQLINDVASLDNSMGVTLDRWQIKLRY